MIWNCRTRAFGLIVSVILLVSLTSAAIITVCLEGCEYTSIQAAIDAANSGDIIEVHSGVYPENVDVNKQLTLKGIDTGSGMPVIDARRQGSAAILSGGGITFAGFEVVNAGIWPEAGIKVISSGNTVSGNVARNNSYYGIWIEDTGNNNQIVGNAINSSSWFGIYVLGSNNAITSNKVSQNKRGMYFYHSRGNTISENTFTENKRGCHLYYSDGNWIFLNNFFDNDENVVSESSSNILNSPKQVRYKYRGTVYNNYAGNWWGKSSGPDTNDDGLWDNPFSLDSESDAFALISPWQNYILALRMEPNVTDARVGETISCNYTVENFGEIAVLDLELIDDRLGVIDLDKSELAPGEIASGRIIYTVREADLPGPLGTSATIFGSDLLGEEISAKASASVDLLYASGISISAKADATSSRVGENIRYTCTIQNIGDVTVKGLVLTDERQGMVALPRSDISPGENVTCAWTYVADEMDLPGPVENAITVSGVDIAGDRISANDNVSVNLTYASSLTMTVESDAEVAGVGDTFNCMFEVKNSGDVTVSGLVLTDDKLGEIALDRVEIAPGENAKGAGAYMVAVSDLPGPIENMAIASGADIMSKKISASCNATVDLVYASQISVTIKSDIETAQVGDTITFSYVALNSGNLPISEIVLTDDRLGEILLDKSKLSPGESATGTKTYAVKEVDLPGPIENTANVSGTDALGNVIGATGNIAVNLIYESEPAAMDEAVVDEGIAGDETT